MITLLGWLSGVVFGLGLLSGGHITAVGLTVTAHIRLQGTTIIVNPYVAVRVDTLGGRVGGLTLGDTSLVVPYASVAYEHTHTAGWDHFGLDYPLHIFAHPCEYDPAWAWSGHCNNVWPTWSAADMLPTTGAVIIYLQ